MFSGFESFVALRYLRSRRKEVFISIITIISVLGVAISVMVLDIVLAVMTGFERELQDKLVNATAHIQIRRYGGELHDWEEMMQRALTIDGVVSAEPYTYQQAMLTSGGSARGIIIRGVADAASAREKIQQTLSPEVSIDKLFHAASLTIERPDGSMDDVQLPPLLIGRELARQLRLSTGTPVSLFAPKFSASPQGLIPKVKRFSIIGSYHSGLVEYETGLAYTSISEAQRFFGLGSGVTGIEITLRDLFQAKKIAAQMSELFGKDDPLLDISDWTEPNRALWDALSLEKRVYFIVLLLLILIASFSIVSTLVMVVMEKGKDIAVLKAMGASNRVILQIFLRQGSIIGVAGVTLGTLLGFLGCIGLREYGFQLDESVFSLSKVPVHLEWTNFFVVAIVGAIITSLAGIYPAYRASQLRPAEALRFE